MKGKKILYLILGIGLFVFGFYMVNYISTHIDFESVKIMVNDEENLWQFLAFMPILISMFIGGLLVVNSIADTKVLSIAAVLLAIGLVIFIRIDLYGFVTIMDVYRKLMSYLFWILIGLAGVLVIEFVVSFIIEKNKKQKTVNLEIIE